MAMEYLKHEGFKEAFALLKKAENLLNEDLSQDVPNRLKLLGITLNNLGCFYKKRKQPKVALGFLKQALDVEMQTERDFLNLAGSYLNICVVFSSLGMHQKALNHARTALELLNKVNEGQNMLTKERVSNLVTTMVIVHYNLAVELEYLKQFKEAVTFYETGYELSAFELGSRHPLTLSLAEAGLKVNKKMQSMKRSTQLNFFQENAGFSYDTKYRLPSVKRRGSDFYDIN
jgi:tetratricopeptide (TPR) repeat protein